MREEQGARSKENITLGRSMRDERNTGDRDKKRDQQLRMRKEREEPRPQAGARRTAGW